MKKEINSIKLNDNGTEFEVYLSKWTAGKMDKAQTLLAGTKEIAGFTGSEYRVNDILSTYELAPVFVKENEGFKAFLPILEKLDKGELSKEQVAEKLGSILKATTTLSDKIRNGQILRELVRLMCLETQITDAQKGLIKSEIDSDFWEGQDADLMRDTGENFRRYVMEYSNRS